jgi:hypothetical protein
MGKFRLTRFGSRSRLNAIVGGDVGGAATS